MKKSLLVLAVLSAVTAASAQSSVTLYGVVDAAVGATNHPGLGLKNDQFQMISGKALNTGTSRFGFRGLEDLGDGLKVGFNLEAGFDLSTGAGNLSGGQMFSRQANVSLMGGFGEVRLGRMYNPSGLSVVPWELTGLSLDSAVASQFGAGGGGQRDSSMILYKSPKLSGFSFIGGVVPKGNANFGTTADPKGKYDLAATYANGPVGVGFAYNKVQDGNEGVVLGGKYDFGAFQVAASYNQYKLDKARQKGNDIINKGFTLGVGTKVGPVRLTVDVARDTEYKDTNFLMEARYPLSKRTFLYAVFLRDGSGKITASNPIVAGTTSNQNINGYSLGIRHNF